MTLLKALMLCLLMVGSTIMTPAIPNIIVPQGGTTDVLQIGRSAIVVTIDRNLLSPEIQDEIATVTLTDAQNNLYTYKCKDSALVIPTTDLSTGICTVRIRIGELLDESHEFMQ